MILSTKLRNAVKKKAADMDLVFTLKDTVINGEKRGCRGFIRNTKNNSVVYVNTEEPCLSTLHFMYRYANDEKDYVGHHNRWADTLKELVEGICSCLQKCHLKKGE